MRCLRRGTLLKEIRGCCAIGGSVRKGLPAQNWWCAHSCRTGGVPAHMERQLVVRVQLEEACPCGTVLDKMRQGLLSRYGEGGLRADFECLTLVAWVVPLILSMLWRHTHQMALRYGECDPMWPTRDACWIRCSCGSLSVGDTWLDESDLDSVVWHVRTCMRRNKHKNVSLNIAKR